MPSVLFRLSFKLIFMLRHCMSIQPIPLSGTSQTCCLYSLFNKLKGYASYLMAHIISTHKMALPFFQKSNP